MEDGKNRGRLMMDLILGWLLHLHPTWHQSAFLDRVPNHDAGKGATALSIWHCHLASSIFHLSSPILLSLSLCIPTHRRGRDRRLPRYIESKTAPDCYLGQDWPSPSRLNASLQVPNICFSMHLCLEKGTRGS
ncbi:hypothetical protein QC764_001064 [Podospora pseudoanserina]|uniref:Uncharacterized protein n=1 Tax=Podospora pseudoanserina TaxID=2609844 RepID=A0ABR0IFH7_9PEZI|nr:hypothetical protein QC764_001064 [Podospora pseudoanserina]